MSYARPGVFVEEKLSTSATRIDSSTSATVFVASHGRGPTDTPVTVESWSDFTRIFGGFPARTSLLPYALYQFYNNGGQRAHVLRVAGDGAMLATRDINDRADVPEPTLQVNASSVGEWGNALSIEIGTANEDRFNLRVYEGGTNPVHLVERWNDLSMDPDSQRYAPNIVNSSGAGSTRIVLEDLESATAGASGYADARPAETEDPIELAGGVNGADPTPVNYTDALTELSKISRPHLVNFPGVADEAVINDAITYCRDSGNAFLLVDPEPGASPAEVISYTDALQASSYAAVYYPWVHVSDPASNSSGATRKVPPGGAVAGLIAGIDNSRGVWKAPAGLTARISGAVSLERSLRNSELDDLNQSHVNAVRHIPGEGVVVMGARTLKRVDPDKFIPIRRTLIFLRQALLEATQWAIFEPNDELLWSDLEAKIANFLTGIWQQGGLRGATANEAFFVRVNASVNPPEAVAAGEIRVEVGVALQYPAEFIVIRLSQWEGGQSAVEATVE